VQRKKLGFSLVGVPGKTERPFKPPRVLLGAFFIVLNYFITKINVGNFSRGKIGYTEKCDFPQGNLVFTKVKLPRVSTPDDMNNGDWPSAETMLDCLVFVCLLSLLV